MVDWENERRKWDTAGEDYGSGRLPRLACTECDWHGNGEPSMNCPLCGNDTCLCQCGEVEEIARGAERAAKEILARSIPGPDDTACGQADGNVRS